MKGERALMKRVVAFQGIWTRVWALPFVKADERGIRVFLHEEAIYKGKEYGTSMGGSVCCPVGSASGLHSAEVWDLHLTARCLPGGQSRQDRSGTKETNRLANGVLAVLARLLSYCGAPILQPPTLPPFSSPRPGSRGAEVFQPSTWGACP